MDRGGLRGLRGRKKISRDDTLRLDADQEGQEGWTTAGKTLCKEVEKTRASNRALYKQSVEDAVQRGGEN